MFMEPFDDEMFDDRVIIQIARPGSGLHGGSFPTYPESSATLLAYVETTTDNASRVEVDGITGDAKPVSRTMYRVFTGTDPSVGMSREIMVDDRILWVNEGLLRLQVIEAPQRQRPLWLTQCVRAV